MKIKSTIRNILKFYVGLCLVTTILGNIDFFVAHNFGFTIFTIIPKNQMTRYLDGGSENAFGLTYQITFLHELGEENEEGIMKFNVGTEVRFAHFMQIPLLRAFLNKRKSHEIVYSDEYWVSDQIPVSSENNDLLENAVRTFLADLAFLFVVLFYYFVFKLARSLIRKIKNHNKALERNSEPLRDSESLS